MNLCTNCGLRRVAAWGLCSTCYYFKKRTGRDRPPAGARKQRGTCSIPDCGRPHYARSWCRKHFDRWRQARDPVAPDKRISFNPLGPDLWDQIDSSGGPTACWPWRHGRDTGGYGVIGRGAHHYRSHRLAYMLAVGPIPVDYYVLHRCDNPPCCNPAHLFLGSHADNMADMARKGRGRNGQRSGEENTAARLTNAQVAEIRNRPVGESQTAIAADYGVNPSTISRILRRERRRSG